MTEVLKLLIEKLPVKFIATIFIVVLGWFGVLTGVALTMHRSVDFFPPRIGTDQILVAEIEELARRTSQLEQREQAQRARLLEVLVQARAESISLQRSLSLGTTDAKINVSKSEEALRVEDEAFLKTVQELDAQVKKLADRL